MATPKTVTALLGLSFVLATALSFASGGGSRPTGGSNGGGSDEAVELYNEGVDAVNARDYDRALDRFKKALKKDKRNPDILNMVAYSYRKTGDLEKAFEHYEKALDRRKDFPQAREYLAEAHIQAALVQASLLHEAGVDGEEELRHLVDALERALTRVKAGGSAQAAVDPTDW